MKARYYPKTAKIMVYLTSDDMKAAVHELYGEDEAWCKLFEDMVNNPSVKDLKMRIATQLSEEEPIRSHVIIEFSVVGDEDDPQ